MIHTQIINYSLSYDWNMGIGYITMKPSMTAQILNDIVYPTVNPSLAKTYMVNHDWDGSIVCAAVNTTMTMQSVNGSQWYAI